MAGPLSAAMSDEGTGSFDNIKYRLANIDPQDGLVVAPLHSHHDEDSATTAIIALHVYKAQDFTNRLSTLTDELERAEQCREKWYDTSFTNGTPQRFLRVKFVESLKRDIRAEVALVGKHIEEHENVMKCSICKCTMHTQCYATHSPCPDGWATKDKDIASK